MVFPVYPPRHVSQLIVAACRCGATVSPTTKSNVRREVSSFRAKYIPMMSCICPCSYVVQDVGDRLAINLVRGF